MKKNYLYHLSGVILTFLFFSSTLSAQVVNGSFENTTPLVPRTGGTEFWDVPSSATIANWNYVSGAVEVHERRHGFMGCPPGGDSQHVDLNRNGYISQLMTGLVPGVTYTITLQTRTHSILTSTQVATANLRVGTTGSVRVTSNWSRVASGAGTTWTAQAFVFTAVTTTDSLVLRGISSGNPLGGLLVDMVQINGDFPDDTCSASIGINRLSCNEFIFGATSTTVDIDGAFWTLNGIKTNLDSASRVLPPGNHVICLNYLGTLINNPDEVCCQQVCTTMNIAGVATIYDTVSYCEYNAASGSYAYNPCAGGSYAGFILRNNPPIPGSSYVFTPCMPVPMQYLTGGDYIIENYDADTCLRRSTFLHVKRMVPDTSTCYERFVSCGMPPINENTVMPDPMKCPNCYNPRPGATYVFEPPVMTFFDPVTNTRKFTRKFIELNSCHICIFSFDIIDSACSFSPQFSIITNTIAPRTYDFSRLAPTNNICDSVRWLITDTLGNFIAYSSSPAPGATFTHSFASPGTYRIKMTVCVCVCSTSCCLSKEYLLTVNNNPLLVVRDPASGKEIYSSKQLPNVYFVPEGAEGGEKRPEPKTLMLPELNIVPNPTSSVFRVQAKNYDGATYESVELMTVDGKSIGSYENIPVSNEYNLSGYAAGTYLVKVKVYNVYFQLKVVLQ